MIFLLGFYDLTFVIVLVPLYLLIKASVALLFVLAKLLVYQLLFEVGLVFNGGGGLLAGCVL